MKKTVLGSLILGTALGVVFFASGNDVQASEVNRIWTPRTVEQIKADINKAKDNQYTIVWGDTLSGISQATNITVQKLADINKIANVDLIYAGNTLVFDGNVVTAKNDKGETVAQTMVQPKDKNDVNKPVGKQAHAKPSTEKTKPAAPAQNNQGTTKSSTSAEPSNSGTSASNTGTNGSRTGTNSSTGGTTASTGKVETPAQPPQPATPSQPAESKPAEKPSTPSKPTTPTQPSTGENQGGTTIPVIDPSTVADQEPHPDMIGNSGMVFNSEEEAMAYGWKEIKDENSKWYGYGFGVPSLLNKNLDLINKWSVDFYETDQ
ncbi:TPA: LysM peptidoglycan-binding domain-containing protein [Enterococcus faecalis]|nr:LysM peptidoglycan-binding domain-containing protein [Enterococcus faecalis]